MTTDLGTLIADVVASIDLGTPSAVKRGRRSEWPYVPILVHVTDAGRQTTTQIPKRAFVTRDEAVQDATDHLDRLRAKIARDLARPECRALREYYGLPRELPAG